MNAPAHSVNQTAEQMANRSVKGVHVYRQGEGAWGLDRTKGLIMWLLLIVLLTLLPGMSRVTVLDTFTTYEECQPERNRIGFEMAESYPYENDFRVVCEFRETEPAPSPNVPMHYMHYRRA